MIYPYNRFKPVWIILTGLKQNYPTHKKKRLFTLGMNSTHLETLPKRRGRESRAFGGGMLAEVLVSHESHCVAEIDFA